MNKPIFLSIDMDFFSYEDPWWDFAHGEGLHPDLWAVRMISTSMSGMDLLSETSLDKADFHPLKTWQILREAGWHLSPDCQVTVSDSHMHAFVAGNQLGNVRIVNFDAHHDLGYASRQVMRKRWKSGRIQCEDWLWFLLRLNVRMDAVTIFPSWKPGGDWPERPHWDKTSVGRRAWGTMYSQDVLEALAGDVVGIHIARSGAWLPPWHDPVLPAMLEGIGGYNVLGDTDPTVPRDFDAEACVRQAEEQIKGNEVLLAFRKAQQQVSSA